MFMILQINAFCFYFTHTTFLEQGLYLQSSYVVSCIHVVNLISSITLFYNNVIITDAVIRENPEVSPGNLFLRYFLI